MIYFTALPLLFLHFLALMSFDIKNQIKEITWVIFYGMLLIWFIVIIAQYL